MLDIKKIDYLFLNLKEGDMIGFHYQSKLYYPIGWLIKLFSFDLSIEAKDKNMLKIEHIGMVSKVVRNENLDHIVFYFGEMTGADNRANKPYSITRLYNINEDKYYHIIDSHFLKKYTKIYLLQHKHILTEEQKNICFEFWNRKKDYNPVYAIASINYLQKLLKFFGWSKKASQADNFCSSAVNACNCLMGFKQDSDQMPTPAELSKFSYIDKIYEISKK